MKKETTLENKQGCYALTRYEEIAILRLGKDFLFESIDLSVSNRLLEYFSAFHKAVKLRSWQCSAIFLCNLLGYRKTKQLVSSNPDALLPSKRFRKFATFHL